MGYGSFTHFFALAFRLVERVPASVARQIQQSAGGGAVRYGAAVSYSFQSDRKLGLMNK